MRPLRPLEPVEDVAWFDEADIAIVTTVEISASARQIFDCLADHVGWAEWFSPVRSVTDVGPVAGVGSRRRVKVPPLIVDESFLVWDDPSRYTFTITAINLPIVTRMAEDWQLHQGPTSTRVTNVVAADLPRWLRPFRAAVRFGMMRTTSSGPRELKHHVESQLSDEPDGSR